LEQASDVHLSQFQLASAFSPELIPGRGVGQQTKPVYFIAVEEKVRTGFISQSCFWRRFYFIPHPSSFILHPFAIAV
jgi:hypothetical protein